MLEAILFLLSAIFHRSLSQNANFEVTEESRIDTIIGNIAHLHSSLNQVSYYINSPFLKLSASGYLLINSRIDLESVCSLHEICCGCVYVCMVRTASNDGVIGCVYACVIAEECVFMLVCSQPLVSANCVELIELV